MYLIWYHTFGPYDSLKQTVISIQGGFSSSEAHFELELELELCRGAADTAQTAGDLGDGGGGRDQEGGGTWYNGARNGRRPRRQRAAGGPQSSERTSDFIGTGHESSGRTTRWDSSGGREG